MGKVRAKVKVAGNGQSVGGEGDGAQVKLAQAKEVGERVAGEGRERKVEMVKVKVKVVKVLVKLKVTGKVGKVKGKI